jgi:hypothetical protein
VIVSEESDPRVQAVHEARDFWNAELLNLGIAFRLGAITRVDGRPDIKESVEKYKRDPANSFRLWETLRKINGDVIVVMCDDGINPFTTGRLSPRKLLVAIPDVKAYKRQKSKWLNDTAHEFGHVIGLGDNTNPKTLMCSSALWCSGYPADGILALRDSEKALLIELYPPDWQDNPSHRWQGDAPSRTAKDRFSNYRNSGRRTS